MRLQLALRLARLLLALLRRHLLVPRLARRRALQVGLALVAQIDHLLAVRAAHKRREEMEMLKAKNERTLQEEVWREVMAWDKEAQRWRYGAICAVSAGDMVERPAVG